MMARVPFQTSLRAGSVDLLQDYAQSAGINLQIHPARPRSIYPPTGFVDQINETITYDGLRGRNPVAEVVVVWGLFDSLDAVIQRDAFVDGFLDYVTDNHSAAGAGNLVWIPRQVDEPAYVADWLPEELQGPYYATRFFVEGESWGRN